MADECAAPAPSALYARGVAENRWEDDPAQREATQWLDRIHDEFAARWKRSSGGRRGLRLRPAGEQCRGAECAGAGEQGAPVDRARGVVLVALFGHVSSPEMFLRPQYWRPWIEG